MFKKSLDIIMPVYNEAPSIERTVKSVFEKITARVPESRLIVIDDGSQDGTGRILDDLENESPDLLAVFHRPNRGHGPTIYFGMEKAEAEWLFLLDSDNQIELSDFNKFWERRNEADILIGKRVIRHDPLLRLWLSNIIRSFLQVTFEVKIYDANVPFKLFKRSLWKEVRKYILADTLAPSLFLAVAAKKLGYRMLEIEVRHYPRQTGESSLKKWKLFLFCLKAFKQLMAFRWKLSRPAPIFD